MRIKLIPLIIVFVAVVAMLAATGNAQARVLEPRIINGSQMSNASFNSDWPFLVAIVNDDGHLNPKDLLDQYCGGTLIQTDVVVTAAHCVSDNGFITPAADIAIVGGSSILSANGIGTRIAVTSVDVHPGFDSTSLRSDVAVLHLTGQPPNSQVLPLIQPAESALWGNGDGLAMPGVEIAGWGNIS
ncbi:MAG: trypsin-like serine protease, partial [Thermoleophilia bacterium]|nr:trypsin-like serine protease [Thermoleophilia bacterium]